MRILARSRNIASVFAHVSRGWLRSAIRQPQFVRFLVHPSSPSVAAAQMWTGLAADLKSLRKLGVSQPCYIGHDA